MTWEPDPNGPPANIPWPTQNPNYTVKYANDVIPQQLFNAAISSLNKYPIEIQRKNMWLNEFKLDLGSMIVIPVELMLSLSRQETHYQNEQSSVHPEGAAAKYAWTNGYENSWGPWQLGRGYGIGGKYTPGQLLEVNLNADLAAKALRDGFYNEVSKYEYDDDDVSFYYFLKKSSMQWHSWEWAWDIFSDQHKVSIEYNADKAQANRVETIVLSY